MEASTGLTARSAVEAHLRRGFPGQRVITQGWQTGAIAESNPDIRVLRVDPETRGGLWLHVSSGAWASTAGQAQPIGHEFVLVTPFKTLRAVELLVEVVYYHGVQPLDVGDTVPIGEPWLPGSSCTHLLISAPYLIADELWSLRVGHREIRLLWTIPITVAERDYVTQYGLDALEERFEVAGLEYWDPHRASVV
ncbi:MAG TPA: suppressor of fused domain protein [Mycobacteriales bacterium]|nr:suppressor of fused domain protein [Mycobacteriales bacterium]